MKCLFCGNILPEQSRRGRPKEFCSRECSSFHKFITASEKNLDLIKDRLDDRARERLRGDLFRIANGIKLTRRVS